MPNRFNANYPKLTDENEFEEVLRDLCAAEWGGNTAERNGRSGQKQWGVDIFGQPAWERGRYYGVQCKLRPSQKQLTRREIEHEVIEAKNFPHDLARLIIATDTPRDNRLQSVVREISEKEIANDGFAVQMWFWPDIQRLIATYPSILAKYYYDHLTSVTNTDVLDRLIDRPLQVFSLKLSAANNVSPLEQRLLFRGVQPITIVHSPTEAKAVDYGDLLPDGLLCQVNPGNESESPRTIRRLLTNFLSLERLVEEDCPIFIVTRPDLLVEVQTEVATLHEQPDRFHWLVDDLPFDEIVDQVFSDVFHYGYKRRGTIPTINISTRTRPNRPSIALLDLDWHSHLDTTCHPIPPVWNDLFKPALKAVAAQLTGLKEATRLQINSDLPLPASVALGFHLNVRVAITGVWARRAGTNDLKQLWLADTEPARVEIVNTWVKDQPGDVYTAVIELSVGFVIHPAVQKFISEQEWVPDIWLQTHFCTDEDDLTESQAVAYARAVGRLMRTLTERGITDSHLFLRMPAALAVLIGQQIHACGRLHLYWFDNERCSYKPAFMLA